MSNCDDKIEIIKAIKTVSKVKDWILGKPVPILNTTEACDALDILANETAVKLIDDLKNMESEVILDKIIPALTIK